MLDYPNLVALAAVHRRGSFDAAAAQLNITPSAVSQRIKALEERTGTLLIVRAQPCTATPTALRLIAHLDQVTLLERGLADLRPSPAPTPLRIAVNADSLATWVIPALAACPGFLYDLVIDDQDAAQDWLRRGEVAAAIIGSPAPLQGCDTIPLGALRYRATASPAFIARWFPDGITPAALSAAPGLIFSDKDRLQTLWATRAMQQKCDFPAHRIASTHAFIDACLHGLAWGMNPEPLIADHLKSRRLVELIPHTPLDVPLHWQFSRLTAQAIAPLTDAIRRAASRDLIT
ncbi:MAG: LysR family transcriptional regulator ArgP [Paracoccaceae bacterium]